MSNDNYETPPWLFAGIQDYYGITFDLDAFASPGNALCTHYRTEERDAFNCDWSRFRFVFCNPPYSQLGRAVEKMALEGRKTNVVGIFPPGVCTKWWHAFVMKEAAHVAFPDQRIQFLRNGKPLLDGDGKKRSNDRDSVMVRWLPGFRWGRPAFSSFPARRYEEEFGQ